MDGAAVGSTDYALSDSVGGPEDALACGCATQSCRGTITSDDWRDPDLQRRYAGWFSTYLADRIAGLAGGPAGGTGGTQ